MTLQDETEFNLQQKLKKIVFFSTGFFYFLFFLESTGMISIFSDRKEIARLLGTPLLEPGFKEKPLISRRKFMENRKR